MYRVYYNEYNLYLGIKNNISLLNNKTFRI